MPLSLVSGDTGSWSVKSAAPALILRHLVVCGHAHNCSPVPPVLSHDRFCGTSQWRQGLERQKHGVVACGQHRHLRSSSVDSSFGCSVVLCCKVVLCCISSNKHKKQTSPARKECGARRFVISGENSGMWHCGSVA